MPRDRSVKNLQKIVKKIRVVIASIRENVGHIKMEIEGYKHRKREVVIIIITTLLSTGFSFWLEK